MFDDAVAVFPRSGSWGISIPYSTADSGSGWHACEFFHIESVGLIVVFLFQCPGRQWCKVVHKSEA